MPTRTRPLSRTDRVRGLTFHTLKVEHVHHRVYTTRDEARRDLFARIEGFDNSRRLHSAIGYRSPADMERMAA
jgi:transposase InsO family protein